MDDTELREWEVDCSGPRPALDYVPAKVFMAVVRRLRRAERQTEPLSVTSAWPSGRASEPREVDR